MLNSYLVDVLIREQIAEAQRRAARHTLLRGVSRRSFADAVRSAISGVAGRRPHLQRRPLVQGLCGRLWSICWVVILVAFVGSGCGASTAAEYPTVSGRRVQATSMAVGGATPYRVGAYELVFADAPGATSQARRAALVVDLAGGGGLARGFVEWGRSAEAPRVYIVGGWARQRDLEGEVLTVFELRLDHLDVRRTLGVAPDAALPRALAVRVVVHEGSGDVTLTRRQ